MIYEIEKKRGGAIGLDSKSYWAARVVLQILQIYSVQGNNSLYHSATTGLMRLSEKIRLEL